MVIQTIMNNGWTLLNRDFHNKQKYNSHENISIACILAYFNGSKYIKDQSSVNS